jgi:carboxyl-terminal processing protease
MYFRLIFLFLLCASPLCHAKPPSLTPHDTSVKIQEILKSHVTYKQLNEEIVKRTLTNYLEAIDPLKTYLTENEAIEWENPSDDLVLKVLKELQDANFSSFFAFHDTFIKTIDRRNAIEETIKTLPLPTDVKASEFKDLKWVTSQELLKDRLLRIKALQIETGAKLSDEDKEQFVQKIDKRRLHREEEFKGKTSEEKKQIVLSYVLKSISSSLDSQTAYFTPSEATQFMMQVQQKLYGIGAQLRDDLNGLTVIRLIEGGPAMIGGKMKVGDKIIAVNKDPIVGLDITDAVEFIRGKKGTPVTLTVLRTNEGSTPKEEKLDIEIIRDEVVLKETRLETTSHPFGDGTIGILHLFSFYEDKKSSSALDLYQAIDELKKTTNLKGIILDLRNNAGGLLKQAVAVTGLFISKGVVVSVKSDSGEVEHLRHLDGTKAWDGPLLVLTNKGSASASEIVAQTLQDYGRSIVIGDEVSFGKGTFQTFTLASANYGKVNPKGEYKVTRGRYYTVSGKSPQLVGVQADITIPGYLSFMDVGEKFSKFPVSSDEIPPSFEDSLSDVSPLHRSQIRRLYKFDKQGIVDEYGPYLSTLKSNSEARIRDNKNYQNFLAEIEKKDGDEETVSDPFALFGQNDLQLTEAINVMTDYIFLTHMADSKLEAIAN